MKRSQKEINQTFIEIFEEINNNPELNNSPESYKIREGKQIHESIIKDQYDTPQNTLKDLKTINRQVPRTGYESV